MLKIKKQLDKVSLDYFILNRHISILEILVVNYKVFIKMLHLLIILSKKIILLLIIRIVAQFLNPCYSSPFLDKYKMKLLME